MPWVEIRGVPDWVPLPQLLDAGPWEREQDAWCGRRNASEAADLQARLRNLGMGGSPIEVTVRPGLKRSVVRAARTAEARRLRDTTPGFLCPGARVDDVGRAFLTPEALALELGRRAGPIHVFDACCGCGGNAIGFARAGAQVTAVEPNARRLELARHNARLYGVEHRITFHLADARDLLPATDADLVFLDPPWGQVDRIHTTQLPLLDELIDASPTRSWSKLPPSFHRPDVKLEAWFGRAAGDRQRVKFVLMYLEGRSTP